jgi:uncharacterized protein YndB with AHSA1/START domain
MKMPELPHSLERTVVIKAPRPAVFRYFTDSARWANWWGGGSTIDPVAGGKVYIRYPNGVEAAGKVITIDPPQTISFSMGYVSGTPIPPGASTVTIQLFDEKHGGTRLHLRHDFAEKYVRDQHVPGWRYQLSLFSNVVANEIFADVSKQVDGWFSAWMITDDSEREQKFAGLAAPEIEFRDRNSLLLGVSDLNAHAGAALRYMPGVVLRRKGAVRQCQGAVLAEWTVPAPDGTEGISGTSVFEFDGDCKIRSVTGFANPPA